MQIRSPFGLILTKRRKISTEDAQKYAQEKGMTYIETSAKNFSNVSESFVSCAKMILSKIDNKQIDPKNEVNSIIQLTSSWESRLAVWARIKTKF